MQTNEDLVRRIQAGERDMLMILWGQVRRLAIKTANRWIAAAPGRGLEIEDYLQAAFLALLLAVERFDTASDHKFTTLYVIHLRAEYAAADGLRSPKQQKDPLRSACSLDIPIDKENPDSGSLGDFIPDPAAETAMLSVEDRDMQERLHNAIEKAVSALPDAQQEAIRNVYFRNTQAEKPALSAALRALRHPSVSRGLSVFL